MVMIMSMRVENEWDDMEVIPPEPSIYERPGFPRLKYKPSAERKRESGSQPNGNRIHGFLCRESTGAGAQSRM
jgi:ribosomal protein L34